MADKLAYKTCLLCMDGRQVNLLDLTIVAWMADELAHSIQLFGTDGW